MIHEWEYFWLFAVPIAVFTGLTIANMLKRFSKKKDGKTESISLSYSDTDPYLEAYQKEEKKPKKDVAEIKPKEPEVLDKQLPDTPYPLYNPLKTGRKRYTFAYIKDWWNERKHLDKVAMVNMELNNGFHRTFQIKEKDGGFTYNKKQYVLDEDCKYWNMDIKMYCYDYHEGISVPFKRSIPIKMVKDTINAVPDTKDIDLAFNPSTLRAFIDSEIAKQILKAARMEEWFRIIRTMLLFTLIGVIVILIFIMEGRGLFQNLTG